MLKLIINDKSISIYQTIDDLKAKIQSMEVDTINRLQCDAKIPDSNIQIITDSYMMYKSINSWCKETKRMYLYDCITYNSDVIIKGFKWCIVKLNTKQHDIAYYGNNMKFTKYKQEAMQWDNADEAKRQLNILNELGIPNIRLCSIRYETTLKEVQLCNANI